MPSANITQQRNAAGIAFPGAIRKPVIITNAAKIGSIARNAYRFYRYFWLNTALWRKRKLHRNIALKYTFFTYFASSMQFYRQDLKQFQELILFYALCLHCCWYFCALRYIDAGKRYMDQVSRSENFSRFIWIRRCVIPAEYGVSDP